MKTCARCGTTAPPSFVVCPGCGALFHEEALRAHVARADEREASGETLEALDALRAALALLPSAASQAQALKARIASLEERAPARSRVPALLGGLGAFGIGAWKFIGPILALLPKLKLLFMGLFQMKTVLSLLVTTAIYSEAGFGPPMLGVLASIYVHEMGHVFAFRRYGIEVSAPMFVPGLGAFVRGSRYPESLAAQADVALAGPVWGAVSGLVPLSASFFVSAPWLATVVILIAEVNAFNLLPVWQLDGARAFRTLSKRDRLIVGGVGLAASALAGSIFGMAAAAGFLLRGSFARTPEEARPYARNVLLALFLGLALMRAVAVHGL